MLLVFLALILQSVIERAVRQQMKSTDIKALDIYPEHRLAYHPTTAKIVERFNDTSHYQIVEGNRVLKSFTDELTETQKTILTLMGMKETDYWNNID